MPAPPSVRSVADGLEFKLWGQGDQVDAFVSDVLAQDVEVVAKVEFVTLFASGQVYVSNPLLQRAMASNS